MTPSSHSGDAPPAILLVDDEPLFLASLREGLVRALPDLRFHFAEHGEAALAILDRHPVDLVVTDLKMPVLDGFGLLALMASRHPGVPALVMTAYGTEATEQRAAATGVIESIDKPIELSTLVDRIRTVLAPETQGTLRGVSLPAFLQLLGMERLTGVVQVRSTDEVARLYLRNGEVVHATAGDEEGLAVALRTVALARVEIELRQQFHRVPRTISLSLTELLLEAARLQDETGSDGAFDDLDGAFAEVDTSAVRRDPPATIAAAETVAPTVRKLLEGAMRIDGALGVALVDSETATALDSLDLTPDLQVTRLGVGNSDVVRAKLKTIEQLGLGDTIEDIVITLGTQLHLIRTFSKRRAVFLYLALDRATANLGMARHLLADIERRLAL